MQNLFLLMPNLVNLYQLNILINNILMHTEFNTVKIFYENKTGYLVNQIYANKFNSQHRWIIINYDTYNFGKDFYKRRILKERMIEEALFIHVFGENTIKKFYWLYIKSLNMIYSLKHLLISINDDHFMLNSFLPFVVGYRFNIVLCLINSEQFQIYTTNPFSNNPIQRYYGDIVHYSKWYDRFYSLAKVDVNGVELNVLGILLPPKIFIFSHGYSEVEYIGGTNGYMFNLLPQYFNTTANFMTKRLAKMYRQTSSQGKYHRMCETPHIVYNSPSLYHVPILE